MTSCMQRRDPLLAMCRLATERAFRRLVEAMTGRRVCSLSMMGSVKSGRAVWMSRRMGSCLGVLEVYVTSQPSTSDVDVEKGKLRCIEMCPRLEPMPGDGWIRGIAGI
jgi:hypothetical protein